MKNSDQENADIQIVVDILKEINAFSQIPGRTHTGIGSVPKDPISVLNFADLNSWLTKHKKSWIPLFLD